MPREFTHKSKNDRRAYILRDPVLVATARSWSSPSHARDVGPAGKPWRTSWNKKNKSECDKNSESSPSLIILNATFSTLNRSCWRSAALWIQPLVALSIWADLMFGRTYKILNWLGMSMYLGRKVSRKARFRSTDRRTQKAERIEKALILLAASREERATGR